MNKSGQTNSFMGDRLKTDGKRYLKKYMFESRQYNQTQGHRSVRTSESTIKNVIGDFL